MYNTAGPHAVFCESPPSVPLMAQLRDLGPRRDLQITAIISIGRRNDKAMTKWLIHMSPYHDADRGAEPAGTGLFLALKHQLPEFPPFYCSPSETLLLFR